MSQHLLRPTRYHLPLFRNLLSHLPDQPLFQLWQTGLTFLGLVCGMLAAACMKPLWSKNYERLVNPRIKNAGKDYCLGLVGDHSEWNVYGEGNSRPFTMITAYYALYLKARELCLFPVDSNLHRVYDTVELIYCTSYRESVESQSGSPQNFPRSQCELSTFLFRSSSCSVIKGGLSFWTNCPHFGAISGPFTLSGSVSPHSPSLYFSHMLFLLSQLLKSGISVHLQLSIHRSHA
jgi:hypothetical protein